MGFAADKGLRVKQGDRLVFIVLPREGADGGVKGAIKVEWVRKGDLPEQMKKKKGCRGGRNRPSVWAGGDDGVAHGRGLTYGCTIEAQTAFVFLFMIAVISYDSAPLIV